MTEELKLRLKNIGAAARERHASCEESTASLVGIAQDLETVNDAVQAQKLAAYAISHIAVQLGNAVSALNESAAAQQEIAAYMAEGHRLEQAAVEEAIKSTVKRNFIGKRE